MGICRDNLGLGIRVMQFPFPQLKLTCGLEKVMDKEWEGLWGY